MLPIAVVFEFVVASESDDSTNTQTIREKDLSGCVDPYFAILKFVESWYKEVFDTVPCTIECEAFDQEYEEQNVRKETCEINNLLKTKWVMLI